MRRFSFLCICIFCLLLSVFSTEAQVVSVTNNTNTTPNLAATYGSLAAAITALNAITAISGPVTITLNPGNPQTAPAGGYIIQFTTISNTAASPITFTGSNNTITAFTPQTSGRLYDGIFKLIGADYITIQNFVMQENASNATFTAASNNMTEWAVALLYKSTTDGAQNNTIQNNTISLNRSYQNSFAIYSNTRHAPTTVTTNVDVTNSTSGPNNNNKVYGNTISNVNMGISFIGAGNAANMDVGNDIGGSSAATGNSITNWGGATAAIGAYFGNSGVFHGVFMNHQKDVNISYNTVTSAAISGTTTTVRGIHNRYASAAPTGTFSVTISNNTVSLTNNNASGNFDCIFSEQITALTTATVNINGNSIINNSSSTVNITGINNTSACGVLNINSNIFRNNSSASTGPGGFTAIFNGGAVTTTVNINANSIGDGTGNAFSFSAASSGGMAGINSTAAATASISVSNNNFQGFVHSVTGSGAIVFIQITHNKSTAGLTDNINGNTFTNITANTTGSVWFISRTGISGSGVNVTENCNNNSIVGSFNKTAAGGIVYLYNAPTDSGMGGGFMVQTGNNFSNINLVGSTMAGWSNRDYYTSPSIYAAQKTISNNIFQNWNCGSSSVIALQVAGGGNGTAITGNSIQNISAAGAITTIQYETIQAYTLGFSISNNTIANINSSGNTVLGIAEGSGTSYGTSTISGNTISGLMSAGAALTEAIKVKARAPSVLDPTSTNNITKNKIYDISGNNAGCLVYGIDITPVGASSITNITGNYIGNLTAGITSNGLAIRGISIASTATNATFNIYYNTVYINASSTGTDFGTAALFLLGDVTATTGNAVLRNNIFVNTSTPNGAGVTAVNRRSFTNTSINNYSTSSNNNIYYAGAPSSTRLIYYDASNSDITLTAFKTRMGAIRESNSLTELPPFLSIVGSSSTFLHIDPTIPTQVESGAVNIAGYTDDYDGDIRQGNAGYTGAGTAPDIGADEVEATYVEHDPPVITYTAISSPACTYSGMTITGVTITDATGIPLSGPNVPRIYYKKNTGSWFSSPGTNTGGSATNSTWSFTIVETDMGGVSGSDVVYYYIVAQDITYITNTGSNPSAVGATGVNNVITIPVTPNSYTLKYTLNGTYTVGVGGNFTTLTAAVSAYNNACSLTGPVVFELIDNTYPSETFPITINNHADASNINTLTIRPSATATPVITGTTTTQTINLDGAKYIRIDGRNAGAGTNRSLTITNTSTAIAINFINEAQNNIVSYCNVLGRRISTASGTITFGASAAGTGNDNNTIEFNDIADASGGNSSVGVFSAGTAGRENDNITISNNNIYNFYNATGNSFGIYVLSNSSTWTISNNRIYQTTERLYTSNCSQFGIYVNAGNGYTISNNTIGFANASGTGTMTMIGNSVPLIGFPTAYSVIGTPVTIRFLGIGVAAAAGTATNVDGNTISGIAVYTSSNTAANYGIVGGIYVESGTVNMGANAGNIIGSASGVNSIYVTSSGTGGTFVGIRCAATGNVAIQNNTMGGIIVSGNSSAVAVNFIGVSIGSVANYNVSNNSFGNATADNINVGYAVSGGFLSNAGTLSAVNTGLTANCKGIVYTAGVGAISSINFNNNIFRGWNLSCASTAISAIESSGSLLGSTPVINANNNSFGTNATNWINSVVDIDQFFYTLNITNTFATTYNLTNNSVNGNLFGTKNCAGGSFLRVTGASSANAVTSINGNTFNNVSIKFSNASTLYFIFTQYTLASTGQLLINNNSISGTFTGAGNAAYRMIHCNMNTVAGAVTNISNNNFSNISTSIASVSDLFGIYTYFTANPIQLTITGNTFSNWSYGDGGSTAIDMSDMTGTANCSGNTITNINSQGDFEGVSISAWGSSGTFTVANNNIANVVSSGAGGFIYGISGYISTVVNTTQTNINNNLIHSFSSTSPIAVVTGIYLDNGHSSSTVTVSSNKIYDLSASSTGCRVYGIINYPTLRGNYTYTNNYIGDLRAPNSTVADQAVTGIKLFLIQGQSNVYYNTIHLNAATGSAQFSSADIYADVATTVVLRNNILSNVSFHGASGKTVAYWRSTSDLALYNAASNNNLFYAGTASAQNLIYFDGTNSDITLAAYQARVSTRDDLSTSALPGFKSINGADADYLHLNETGNCATNAKGNNAGILLATDYDSEARSIVAPFVTDIGADEFSKKTIWTGAVNANWNNSGNWSTGIVPNNDDENVVIKNPPATQPVIQTGETYQVASVLIESGATLTNKGLLKLSGSFITAAPASINNLQSGIAEGSVEINGNCLTEQTIAGNVFVSNAVKNFTISNDVKISSVAGEAVNVYNELGFGTVSNKVLTTNDNLVLVSNINGTANVGKIINNNSISGKASVERYINTGTGIGQHGKGWQFLSTPAKGATIFQSWQEGGATPAGYGTIITGTGSGFDITTAQPSMKFFDPAIGVNGDWSPVTSTAGLIEDKRGYMIFVRGDRTITLSSSPANTTTLRIKGTLYQPNDPPPSSTVPAGKFSAVGNPYASAIDINYMKNNTLFQNLNNDVVVWDPLMYGSYGYGGYQTLAAANNYEPTAGGTTYYPSGVSSPFIQSGQAFFVRSSGSAGTVSFNEQAKESSDRLVNKFVPFSNRQYFRAGLFTQTGIVADGNAVVFDNVFANAIDKDDAIKLNNSGENFAVARSGKTLSVEARKNVLINDTIFYSLNNLRQQYVYQLRFAPKNMNANMLNAYLIDKYLHTTTQLSLSDSSFVDFSINNDPLSLAADRFYVVFKKRIGIPVLTSSHYAETAKPAPDETVQPTAVIQKESISIYPNPVENKTAWIHFTAQPTGKYRIQLFGENAQQLFADDISIATAITTVPVRLNKELPAGYYQLVITGAGGRKSIHKIFVR